MRVLLICAGVTHLLVGAGSARQLMIERVSENGRLLVPVRDVAEWLGAEVEWSEATRSVTLARTGTLAVLQVDYPTAWVNGHEQHLDVPPRLIGGRVRVPLRFVAEVMGAQVNYHGGHLDIKRPDGQILRLYVQAAVFTGAP